MEGEGLQEGVNIGRIDLFIGPALHTTVPYFEKMSGNREVWKTPQNYFFEYTQ